MERYQEAPDNRWDRVFCVMGILGALGAEGWLAWRVLSDLDRSHALEFAAAALLIGLILYFLWLLWSLSTLTYALTGNRLTLRQAWSRMELELTPETHLYRWRYRWRWEGGLQRDLPVEAVRLFPPFWVWREAEIWVLSDGTQAVAFRPSQRLLQQIKAHVRQTSGLAG